MPANRDDVRLLRRIFFRRFFQNDLLAPNGGGEQQLGFVYAALAVPGLLATALLLLKYMDPYLSPGRRLLMALDDKLLYVSISMIVTAIAALVAWDSLALDRRDVAVLGTLPVSRRTLFAAKLQALTVFLGSVAVAVNAVPVLLYPPTLLGTMQIETLRAVWLVLVHATVCMAAAGFGFLAVLACRELLSLLAGRSAHGRLSAVVQSCLAVVLATSFLLMPRWANVDRSLPPTGSGLAWRSPPLWFLGVYESLTGRVVLDAPGVLDPVGPLRLLPERAAEDRADYLSYMPTFQKLATTAGVGAAFVLVVGLGGWVLESRRVARRPASRHRRLPRAVRRLAASVVQRACARDPLACAMFFFTLKTALRNAAQRLHLATGAALALAILVVSVPGAGTLSPRHASAASMAWLLMAQHLLVGTLAGTLRMACEVPAELRANWLFRVSCTGPPAPLLRGVRRAVLLASAVPVVALAPVDVLLGGAQLAFVHLVYGVLGAAAVVEWLFLDLRSIPFACAPGSERLKSRAMTIGRSASAIFCLGLLERWALGDPGRVAAAAVAVGAVFIGLALATRRRLQDRQGVVFEEPVDPPTQRLGLSGVD